MSLHFTLARKILAHAKDLLKHIFNEAGHDIKGAEQELLAALKSEASNQLDKIESDAKTKMGSALQQWQKAPRAEDATSLHAAPDMSFDEKEAENDDEAAEEDTPAAPAESVATYPASENESLGNDFDYESALRDAPARTAPMQPQAPEEQSGAFHGDAMPSSAVASEALAESGKDGGAATAAPTETETQTDAESPAETAPIAEPVAADESAPLGGTDAAVADETKAAQQDTPMAKGELDSENQGSPAEGTGDKKLDDEAQKA